MTYSYDRRKIADAPDFDRLIRVFEQVLEHFTRDEAKILADPENYGRQIDAGANVRAAFSHLKRHGIETLFWGLLQEFALPPKERRIIEKAAKTFAKNAKRRIDPKKAVETYKAFMAECRLYLATAKQILANGKRHTDEGSDTTLQAGPFTLINAGGFDAKMMEDVAKVVEKASQLLTRKGLGKVCYGNIQVTNTVGRSASILAFYVVNNDELFVRANLRGKQGPALHSVIHELGHRLHFRFLKSKDAEIRQMYARIGGKHTDQLRELVYDRSKVPAPGETLKDGRQIWVSDGEVVFKGTKPMLRVHLQGKAEVKAAVPLATWFEHTGVGASVGGFVTPYAKKNHQENFAEMVAHYCLGTLPGDQVGMLEEIL